MAKQKNSARHYSEKLQEVLGGCRFSFTKDTMGRVYEVGAPNRFNQDVHRVVMKGLEEVKIYEGTISEMMSSGDVFVVHNTILGKPVEVFVNVNDIVVL